MKISEGMKLYHLLSCLIHYLRKLLFQRTIGEMFLSEIVAQIQGLCDNIH